MLGGGSLSVVLSKKKIIVVIHVHFKNIENIHAMFKGCISLPSVCFLLIEDFSGEVGHGINEYDFLVLYK